MRKRRGSLSEDDDKICLRNGNFLVSDHVIFFPLPAFLATLHQKHIPTAKQKSMTKSFDCLFDSDNYECDGARCACRRGRPPCNLLMIITPDPSNPVIRGSGSVCSIGQLTFTCRYLLFAISILPEKIFLMTDIFSLILIDIYY